IGGFGCAGCGATGLTGFGVMSFSFGDLSFLAEWPTVTLPLPLPLPLLSACCPVAAMPLATAGETDEAFELPDVLAATATPAVRARAKPTSAILTSVPFPKLNHRSIRHSLQKTESDAYRRAPAAPRRGSSSLSPFPGSRVSAGKSSGRAAPRQ